MGDAIGQLLDGRIIPRLTQEVFGLLQNLLYDSLDFVQIPVQLAFALFKVVGRWFGLFASGSPVGPINYRIAPIKGIMNLVT